MERILAVALATLVMGAAACGSSTPPPAGNVTVASGTAGAFTVTLEADAPLGTGANALHARVTTTATGTPATDLSVTIVPMMDMGTSQHGCPVSGPMEYDASSGRYGNVVVFQMAGTWTAQVSLARPGMATAVASLSFPVADAKGAATFQVGTTKYVLSYGYPGPLVVGLNPVVVGLFATTDMGMTFTPVDTATFELVPWMTSMGHGSSGTVQPALVGDGFYRGQVSFSMPGDWDVTVKVTLPGSTAPDATKVFSTVF